MPYDPPLASPDLRDDLFPAKIYTFTSRITGPDAPKPLPTAQSWVPEGATLLQDRARVCLSRTHVWILADSSDGPELIFYAALDDLEGDRKQGFRITTTPSGDNPDPAYSDIVVTRDQHCGCGSRLRSFRPFRSMRMIAGT